MRCPSYEWSFDDVNPPVHALAAIRVFVIDGGTDLDFLKRVFHKLLLNFTWWLNRQDPDGNNLFGGGFLGLDNISPIDRSHLPPGFKLDQADGTAWMAYYSVAMLTLATKLAEHDEVYEDMVVKFLEQTVLIMDALEDSGCYDAEDGFFYDRLTDPSGTSVPIKVQTLVGLIPVLPAVALPTQDTDRNRRLRKRFARPAGTDRPARDPRLAGPRHRELAADAAVGPPDGQTRPAVRHPVRRGGVPVSPRPAVAVQAAQHPLHGSGAARRCHPVRTGRIADRDVRRQFQLAGTGVVAGQLPRHPGPAAVRPVLRSRLHRRIPHPVRSSPDPAGDCR